MEFEWGKRKRLANLAKHGVDFVDASEMFDGLALSLADARKDYGESRYRAIGQIDGKMLQVVYTMRGDTVRLISARPANRKEKALYYDYAIYARATQSNERPH